MTAAADTLPYRDPNASHAERIADLLGRMTVDEKIAQLGSAWVFQIAGPHGLDPAKAEPILRHGIGHITRVSGASRFDSAGAAALVDDLQRHLLDHTRLGIPAIVHEEICSGLMASEAVAFAQAIGVAASFRPEHNQAMADEIRKQMRAIGAHHGLSPVLDICRDPRWGRIEETYGEDPFVVSAMGVAFVRGLQGDDLREGVAATAKHLVGYGASEGGMNWAPAHLTERELRDVYLRPFEAAVREGAIESIMNAYHEIDGVPCGASEWLLRTVLRDEWGFDGTVVSDYFSVKQLHDYHHVVADDVSAAVLGLTTGIDVELPSTDCYGSPLRDAVERGRIGIDVVDAAVARALEAKLRLGLFEQPLVGREQVRLHTRTDAQLALADRVAADTLVLLRNEGALPLASRASIAVIGPNADSPRSLFGDYSYIAHVESLLEVLKSGQNVFAMPVAGGVDVDPAGVFDGVVTVCEALIARLPEAAITHVAGCGVTGDDRSGFAQAVAAAAAADVAVMVMGERSGLTDDCTVGESRDVASLDLPGVQEELVMAVAATGTPVVLVLLAGRPIGSPAVHAAAAAVLMAWLPGERGGSAIADALAGHANPGGKLPVSYPRSSGQIPVFYAHKVSGGRSHWKGAYVDLSNEPLYPFGHGLSYTTFEVVPEPVAALAPPDGTVSVAVTITNTGDRRGDEVVQLYATDPVASITRPVRELCGFARVTLDPGQRALVTFELAVGALGFSGPDLRHVVEPGRIDLAVGTSSDDLVPAGTIDVVAEGPTPVARRFSTPVTVVPLDARASG